MAHETVASRDRAPALLDHTLAQIDASARRKVS